KEPGIIAGVTASEKVLRKFDPLAKITLHVSDGTQIKKGDVILEVEGNTRKLLGCERLLLNIMQRMSGIATHTAKLQAMCAGTRAKVSDTRKTTPGFRFFEKWAVLIGGGGNHRFGL